MNDKRLVYLFCAGYYCKLLIPRIEELFEIEGIIDNNKSLWGNLFIEKYRICSPDVLESIDKTISVFVATESWILYDEICNQLEDYNVSFCHVNEGLFDESVHRNIAFFVNRENLKLIRRISSRNTKAFVLTAPAHSNMGDHAQSYCIEQIIKKSRIACDIHIFDEIDLVRNYFEILYIIRQNIRESDYLFVHSGYRLTDLYPMSEKIVEKVCELFRDLRIVFLPQTIHFVDMTIAKRLACKITDDTVIMCRDIISFRNSEKLFANAKSVLYPDVVTSLIGRYSFDSDRKGIFLCFRDTGDGESTLSDEETIRLSSSLKEKYDITVGDTTIDIPWQTIACDRKKYIDSLIESYSTYKLVITNRFHGTVFALAANTPVIVLPTKDHKVSAGLKWFQEAGYRTFRLCEDLSKLDQIVDELLNLSGKVKNDDYFYRRYFKELSIDEI